MVELGVVQALLVELVSEQPQVCGEAGALAAVTIWAGSTGSTNGVRGSGQSGHGPDVGPQISRTAVLSLADPGGRWVDFGEVNVVDIIALPSRIAFASAASASQPHGL